MGAYHKRDEGEEDRIIRLQRTLFDEPQLPRLIRSGTLFFELCHIRQDPELEPGRQFGKLVGKVGGVFTFSGGVGGGNEPNSPCWSEGVQIQNRS